jgi:flagellar biosynthesis GTPase FlhF
MKKRIILSVIALALLTPSAWGQTEKVVRQSQTETKADAHKQALIEKQRQQEAAERARREKEEAERKAAEEWKKQQQEEIDQQYQQELEAKKKEEEHRQFVKDSLEKAAKMSGDLVELKDYTVDSQGRKRYHCKGFTILLISEISAEVMPSLDNKIDPVVVIPTKVRLDGREYTVTKIGVRAFHWKHVTSVTVPPTINEIKSEAFTYCNITSIALTDKLRTIGDNAFEHCSLTSVSLPNVTTLGSEAFSGCGSLESVVLSPSLKTIG